MEISVFATDRLSGRASCGDEFVQKSAGALGERVDTDCDQIAAADPAKRCVLEDQGRSVFSSDREHLLSPDDPPFIFAVAGDACALQSRLVPNSVYRFAPLARVDGLRFDVLFDLAKRTLPGLAITSKVFAVLDVGWNRLVG